MSVTTEARTADVGLSPRARDLWRASLRYRRLADALAVRTAAQPDAPDSMAEVLG